jgi:hypothetical protein
MRDIADERLAEAASFLTPETRAALASAPDGPAVLTFPAREVALLSCDITAFSDHTRRLLAARADGVEQLHEDLRSHYDGLVSMVLQSGGEPVAFIGDGLLSVWEAGAGGMSEAVLAAASLAQRLADSRLAGAGTFDLNLHVTCGSMRTVELGGLNGRWLSTPLGTAFSDLRLVAGTRAPNSVILSQAAAACCGSDVQTAALPGTDARRLLHGPPVPGTTAKPLVLPARSAWGAILARTPRYVGRWIERVGLEWIAELRPVTVLTVGLHPFDVTQTDLAEHLNTVVQTVQDIVHGRDGSVDAAIVDEKGASVLAFFGTPPDAHSDDPLRGVLSAGEILERLGQMGVEATIGVTTGRAFCGIVGTPDRRTFLVVGDAITLSSRLAWSVASGVLVDEPTFQATRGTVDYGATPVDLTLKGRTQTFPAWTVAKGGHGHRRAGATAGRAAEVAMLRRLWSETARGEDSTSVIVEGESGSGKTSLASDLRRHVESAGGLFRTGSAGATDRDTPFSAFRRLYSGLLGVAPGMTLAQRRVAVLSHMPEALQDRAPLLDAVFPSGLQDTALTAELSGSSRARAIGTLLVDLMAQTLEGRASCLCIDDAQWLDPASVQLLARLRLEVPGLMIVLLVQTSGNLGWLEDMVNDGVHHIRLKPLTRSGVEELIAQRLSAAAVAPDLTDHIEEIAGGHPFVSAELLASLHADGTVLVCEGVATLGLRSGAEDRDSDRTPSLPASLHGMVLQRLDRPEPEQQLSLRVAAVAGMVFPTKLVSDIHPMQKGRSEVHRHLQALSKLAILEPMAAGDRPGYGFSHRSLRDVAYSQLPNMDRRALHARAAEWIETNSGAERISRLQELADHWTRAGEAATAVDRLLEESLRLFRQGFALEAVNVGLRAIRISGVDVPDTSEDRQARIGAAIGDIAARTAGQVPSDLLATLKAPEPDLALKLRTLLSTAPFAFQSNQFEVFAWASSEAMRLVMTHQSGPPHAFSTYSIVIAALTGDRAGAAAWSRAALDLDAALGGDALPAVGFIDTWFHSHWREPQIESVARTRAAAERAGVIGDAQFASYNISGEIVMRAAAGEPLEIVLAAADRALDHSLHRNARMHVQLERQFARALRGETLSPLSLSSADLDEGAEIGWVMDSEYVNQIGYVLATRLKLHAFAGDWTGALALADALVPLHPAIAGQTAEFDALFHTALSRLALILEGAVRREALEAQLTVEREKLSAWRRLQEENFALKSGIVATLQDAVGGDRRAAAARLAGLAGAGAGRRTGLSDRAVALDFAARLDPAGPYHDAAVRAYQDWGATAVARRLSQARLTA